MVLVSASCSLLICEKSSVWVVVVCNPVVVVAGDGGSEEVEVGSEENPRSGRADAAWLAKRGMTEVVEENPPAYLKVEHPLDNTRRVAMLLIEKCQELGREKKGYGT